eukprot:TRINITY_DN22424_c0_g1_i1.p1 TRINITY_DN22424_c0_g1~~TRINITY_DN22424_c0_g1_i1.p1  ORF type:complete len:410 (-),score=102.78 TRINITY_DN22424_c0_g1_i1:80-1309(-)
MTAATAAAAFSEAFGNVQASASGGSAASASASGAGAASSKYADALRERLRQIRAELETESVGVLALRQCLTVTRNEAEAQNSQLASLRDKWTVQQPKREAVLKDAAEQERRLADREKRCAEAVALHAAAEMAARDSSPRVPRTPVKDASADVQDATEDILSALRPCGIPNGGSTVATRERDREREKEQRHYMGTLEESRTKLATAVQDLRDAVQQEATDIEQTRLRNEAVRKENRAMRTAADAARENAERTRRKIEALDNPGAVGEQRRQILERQVADARAEVRGLREELAAQTQAAAVASSVPQAHAPVKTRGGKDACGGSSGVGTAANSARKSCATVAAVEATGPEAEAAILATNRRLHAKVDALQEELRKRDAELEELRARRVAGALVGASAESGVSTDVTVAGSS